ncbi:MAG: phosphoenolpyruvate--protein phosphotransferase [Parvularculales bacterium]
MVSSLRDSAHAMQSTIVSTRDLLRRLRSIMAGDETGRARIDQTAQLITAHIGVDVCSIYLVGEPENLVLRATCGLKPGVVDKITLAFGEGLVGDIALHARPLNLAEAQSNPKFTYQPESGEEKYKSLMGVPILRAARVIGVLVVQNREERIYSEEMLEDLQTISMVLAELVVASHLVEEVGLSGRDAQAHTEHIRGVSFAGGVALGHVVLHEPRVLVDALIAEDTDVELKRLEDAINDLQGFTDRMLAMEDLSHAGQHRDILEAYRMFAHDRGWRNRLREAVRTGLTAEAAVERVRGDIRARFRRQTDPYLRERLHDLEDLANRLLRHLSGLPITASEEELPEDAIVIARNMGPGELLSYNRERLRGLVLEEGARGAHVTIVARALGIPIVGRSKDILLMTESGSAIIVDGDAGEVYIHPDQNIIAAYADKVRLQASRQARYRAHRHKPAITLDGVDIDVNINAGLLVELPLLEASGAGGIGLFRTELQFMIASTLPRLKSQADLYRQVLGVAGTRPVVFRTLDAGGDKILPYMEAVQEENPMMGWRAIRMALDRPALLRYQLRALLMASRGHKLRLMFPMISTVEEFKRARALVNVEQERMVRFGRQGPDEIRVGVMLEVPALVWQLDTLLPLVDFVSVGSNDLLQFLFASDRGNIKVSNRYDPLNPAVLRMLRQIVLSCRQYNVPLSLCGEIAGYPLEAMALIGLGFRNISMTPASVGPVKMMIRSVNHGALGTFVEQLCDAPQDSVRGRLLAYACEHDVDFQPR